VYSGRRFDKELRRASEDRLAQRAMGRIVMTGAIDANQMKLERKAESHRHEAYGGKNPNGISWVYSHGRNTLFITPL
jgi:hypothetical protein